MSWPSYVLVVGLLCVSLAVALQAQSQQRQESVYAELGKAPPKFQQMQNPLAKDPDAAVAGGILFEEHCESCHGKEAVGGKKAPTLRAMEVRNAPPGAIFWILSNGVVRKKMPVWSKLPEPERWQLVSYIEALNGEAHPVESSTR
jgi:mono/diheme cytochrome c family protein